MWKILWRCTSHANALLVGWLAWQKITQQKVSISLPLVLSLSNLAAGCHSCYGWKWHFLAKKQQYRKTFITQPKQGILLKYKVLESLGSGFVIFEKKVFFVLGMAHGDPIFAQVGLKNSNF